MSAIFPKLSPAALDPGLPIFFFAGPDSGGGGWQKPMYGHVSDYVQQLGLGDFLVAIPCRYTSVDDMFSNLYPNAVQSHEYQREWEEDYIEKAALTARRGCLVFWLPEESKSAPRMDGQPFARDTRRELGMLTGWLRYDQQARFVIGAEPGFPGLSVIHRGLTRYARREVPVYGSIQHVARAAVDAVLR